MNCDDTVWQVCGEKGRCAYRKKYQEVKLCSNKYNVCGTCSRVTCPLANSYYGTIIEIDGVCILFLKTAERVHLPKKMWEKIVLPSGLEESLAVIDQNMTNIYKPHQIMRVKQRLIRIRQYLKNMQKMEEGMPMKLAHETRKLRQREKAREEKALKAAQIPNMIEEELLKRLKEGVYDDIYNYKSAEFDQMLEEGESDDEEENAVYLEESGQTKYIADNDEDEDDMMMSSEDGGSGMSSDEYDDDDEELLEDEEDEETPPEGFAFAEDVELFNELVKKAGKKKGRVRLQFEDEMMEDEEANHMEDSSMLLAMNMNK